MIHLLRTNSAEYNSAFGYSLLSSITTGIIIQQWDIDALKNNTTGS